MATEIFMPKMSDHMETGEVVAWLANEGDAVEEGQTIAEISTDKVTAELPAPASGILKGIRRGAEPGNPIDVGEVFGFIAAPDETVPELPPVGEDVPPAATANASTAASGTPEDIPTSAPVAAETKGVRSSPAARRLARELEVDLGALTGTGPRGRITEEDVRSGATTTAPAATGAATAVPDDVLTLNAIERQTADRMTLSAREIPQFNATCDAEVSGLLAWRKRDTVKRAGKPAQPSVTALLVSVVAATLRQHPRLNAHADAKKLTLRSAINIGVALGSSSGLVVPVIKDADRLSLQQIVDRLEYLKDAGKRMQFAPTDLQDVTFTLSNLGMFAVDRFTALVNPPNTAILAVGRVRTVAAPTGSAGDTFEARPFMTCTVSADHRAVDGMHVARFLDDLSATLASENLSDRATIPG